MSNLVGQQISHYQIRALLGSGRIGTVYQAVDLEDMSLVALKIIDLDAMHHTEMRTRFLQEVKSMPRLEHPSIVNVFEAGIDTQRDLVYMTMAYVAGRNLSAYLQQLKFNQRQLGWYESLIAVAQVAEALGYAHQKGMIHRDVRPGVILFRTDDKPEECGELPGRATIGDFSLRSILEQEAEPFAGSLPYMPPEAFLAREIDGRSDLYSLGVVLYELVTGQLPFNIRSLSDAARKHPYEDPPAPTTVRPDLPLPVETAVLKAMAKKPEARYPNGQSMATALRQIAQTLVTRKPGEVAQAEIQLAKTQVANAEMLAIDASLWSADQDRVTITKDIPRSLNRQVITIGRGETNDLVLPDSTISRQHAQLERTATGWQVRDLGSQNGTYLAGKVLLPDIPEPWESYQTLRIGSYFLQLQLGKGYRFDLLPFSATLLPESVQVQVGQTAVLQVTVFNRGANVIDLSLKMGRLPTNWYSLPPGPIRLKPDEQQTVTVRLHPPLAKDTVLGGHRFLLELFLAAKPDDKISLPGTLTVEEAEQLFQATLTPTAVVGKGNLELTLRNSGLDSQNFRIRSEEPTQKVRFALWRRREVKPTPTGAGAPSKPPASMGGLRRSPLRRLPMVQYVLQAPRRISSMVQMWPRRALNKILPGLGQLFRMPNLAAKTPKMSGGVTAPRRVQPAREQYEEVVFPGNVHVQTAVAPGADDLLLFRLQPHKRPFWGTKSQTLPFDLIIENNTGQRQTLSGQLEVKPRVRSTVLAVVLLMLIMLACVLSAGAITVRYNPTVVALLTASQDLDGDGLSNFAEVYRYQTDPNRADTDGDGVPDGEEVTDELNPLWADTDGDGLNDAVELRLNTNPRVADTDGDLLADGLEVLTLQTDPLVADALSIVRPTRTLIAIQPTPTATAVPTTPTPTPPAESILREAPPAQTAQTLRLVSEGTLDGHVVQEGLAARLTINQADFIQVGEGENDERQYKGFLTFDTAELPDDALIQTAVLRLHQTESSGQPALLGQLHGDIAPLAGFNNNMTLENEDFSANAAAINVLQLTIGNDDSRREGVINERGLSAINRRGATQFRLYFTLPNNNDGLEDWLRFAAAENRALQPELEIVYTLP